MADTGISALTSPSFNQRSTNNLEVIQINLQHSKGASGVLTRCLQAVRHTNIALIQEPWIRKGSIVGLNFKGGNLIYKKGGCSPRTCIVISDEIKFMQLQQFCSRDITSLVAQVQVEGQVRAVVFAAAYFPFDSDDPPPPKEFVELVDYCKSRDLPLVAGVDANSHHVVWGSTDTNTRGERLMEFLIQEELDLLNRGSKPTFVISNRKEVLDITVVNKKAVEYFSGWHVSEEESCSDHRQIRFYSEMDRSPVLTFRNPKRCNWGKFKECLEDKQDILNQGEIMDKIHFEVCVDKVQECLLSAYRAATPAKVVPQNSGKTAWWNPGLATQRKATRALFRRARITGSGEDWRAYKTSLREYKKSIRRSRRQGWADYVDKISNTQQAARLFKILKAGRSEQIGSMLLPTGKFTESHKESLEYLFQVHFPGSQMLSEREFSLLNSCSDESYNSELESSRDIEALHQSLLSVAPQYEVFTGGVSSLGLPCGGIGEGTTSTMKRASPGLTSFGLGEHSERINGIVNYSRIKWAIQSFSPFKSPGPDGLFPALLQESLEYILPILCKIFKFCLAHGIIPRAWKLVRVAFIPKPGKASYDSAKAFRPISLSSFLLKALERLVDRYLREVPLSKLPMHANQHAYSPGKSTETALHNLVGRIEYALHNKEFALGAFLDIEGAYNHARFDVIRNALVRKKVDGFIIKWIEAMLNSRAVFSELGYARVCCQVGQGCPQGGVLSPTLWNLIVDSLLVELNGLDYYCQFYADDGAVLIVGKFLNTVCDRMQEAIGLVEEWCVNNVLTVSAEKLELILFTNKRKLDGYTPIKLQGKEIILRTQTKVLGVILDSKLSWKEHLQERCRKAVVSFWQLKRVIGKKWGFTPKIVMWLYCAVIRPMICYASVVWWSRTSLVGCVKDLNKLQRLACLGISGAMKSTPLASMEIILGLLPLDLFIKGWAISTAYRLHQTGQWRWKKRNFGHLQVYSQMRNQIPLLKLPGDFKQWEFNLEQPYTVEIPSREQWNDPVSMLEESNITCFTDGSKVEDEGSGAGVYSPQMKIEESYCLGGLATVPQTETFAVIMCCKKLLEFQVKNQKILVCSDSRATLGSLVATRINSELTADCKSALCELSSQNEVKLLWVPGHKGIEGNERADQLAKEGATSKFEGPEPVLGLAKSTANAAIRQWLSQEQGSRFQYCEKYKETKVFLLSVQPEIWKRIIMWSRKNVKKCIAFITGHCTLKGHLTRMGIEDNSQCPRCQEGPETPCHLVTECEALSAVRQNLFGRHKLKAEQILEQVTLSALLKFIRRTDGDG